MAINWITPAGILVSDYEENELKDVFINFEQGDIETEIKIISGSLPEGVTIHKVRDGRYELRGFLPIVSEETTFYFTIRAFNEIDRADRYFGITVKNKIISWDETQSYDFTFSETTYVSSQLKLINATGNETFIKLNGELPKGIILNKTGLIYGVTEEVPEEVTYYCTIGVMKDNQIILEKECSFNIVKLHSLKEPIWITESGFIGAVNYNEHSTLFVKAYDPSGSLVSYRLKDEDSLPEGLELTNLGRIEGQLKTEYTADWEFIVIAGNGLYEVERKFVLSTNVISNENDIIWVSNTLLGNFRIGENIAINIETNSTLPVKYNLISSALPLGLSFYPTGEIIGSIEYQDKGFHSFLVEASNGVKTIQKEFIINVVKGLGKNAVKCYFYINHEYDNEYNKLVGSFDRNTAFSNDSPVYKINPYPEIDICNLSCFDSTLLKQMLYFNEPVDIVWEKTIRKNYIKNNNVLYSVFYKNLREHPSNGNNITFQGNKIYVKPSKLSPTGYVNEYTNEPIEVIGEVQVETRQGKKYIYYYGGKVYVEILSDLNYYEKESLLVVDTSINPVYTDEYLYHDEKVRRNYIVKNNEKCEVLKAREGMLINADTRKYLETDVSTSEIFYEAPEVRYYFINDNTDTVSFASTSEIRNILQQKIYVEKNPNNVLYDTSTQTIISDTSEYPIYTICWDEERQTYYAKYNGEREYLDVYAISKNDESQNPNLVYASWVRDGHSYDMEAGTASTESFEDIINCGKAGTEDFKEIVDCNKNRYVVQPVKVYTEYLNTDIDYKQYLIYEKGTNNLQEGIIFKLDWDVTVMFIILDGEIHHIKEIEKPWIFVPSMNESIGYPNEIVLPYISDEDVNDINSKPYIQFFDTQYESLPAWKSRTIPEWEPSHSYVIGDVFTFNGEYYIVIQNFVSTRVFDMGNTRKMSELEVSDYQKTYYFPTLDLFYAQNNTNLMVLNELNTIEEKGGYWTNRKFVLFETHFKPLYNSNIDNFSVCFYNHTNKRTPEFQLI